MNRAENGFNSLPDPEIIPDKDTLELVLSDIAFEAMVRGLQIHLGNADARKEAIIPEIKLSGEELDAAVLDLNASVVRDSFEFEHRDGVREALQKIADRIIERLVQIEESSS